MQLQSTRLLKELDTIGTKAKEIEGLLHGMHDGGLGNNEVGAATSVLNLGDSLINRVKAWQVPERLEEQRGRAATHLTIAVDTAFDIPTIQGSHARQYALENLGALEDDLAGMRRSIKRHDITRVAGFTALGVAGATGAVAGTAWLKRS